VSQSTGEPSWRWRRAVILATCLYCAVQIAFLVGAADTRVNETIAFGLVALMGVLILGYVGFATAQDIAAIMATRSATPYQPPTQYPSGGTLE
jgi:hypothetical protein